MDRRGVRIGHAFVEDGTVVGIHEGECPDGADMCAVMVRGAVNAHTHCADYGLDVPPGMSLEELVAPPDGLKHRYLSAASPDRLVSDMARFSSDSRSHGSSVFVDFREGGAAGCRMLRSASPDAVILGRPVSPVFDPEEVADILSVADGIGLPSVSDMDRGYIEQVADAVRDAGGIFAIHLSERVREDVDFVLSLDPAFVVHMCEATDGDLLKCAEAEVPVVVCPRSNAYFGKAPPLARMADIGVDTALGTDNGMLCGPDLGAEAAAFRSVMSSQGGDPDGVWPTLVTVAGKLLYRQKRIGRPLQSERLMLVPCRARDGRDGADPTGEPSFGLDIRD